MMPSAELILFALGARLHKSAAEVEQLSAREIAGWINFFTPAAAPANDDGALELSSLSRTQLRAMFHG